MLSVERTCVVLVDVQEKLLPAMAEAEQVVKNCGILLQIANTLKIPVLRCQQYPQGLGQTVEPLRAHLEGVEVIDKMSFSCCGQPEFCQRLQKLGVETAIVCGIESHVCVFGTVMDLMQKGLGVQVIADAVSSRTLANKQVGLERMASAGAVVSSTEMLLFELLKTAQHEHFRALSKLIR